MIHMKRLIVVWACLGALLSSFLGFSNAKAEIPKKGEGFETFFIGDAAKPRSSEPKPGLLMSGGGDWPYEAFRWFAAKSGHGHIVVLRASGTTSSADEMYNQVGGFASIRTIVFSSRKASYNQDVIKTIKEADGIFLAGGDQAYYVNYWRGTPVQDAINNHVQSGKPLGGTSAGLAVQGEYLYGSMDGGSITAKEALKDPLGKANTIEGNFLNFDVLKGIVTDSHFKERNRQGRLVAFLAKAQSLSSKPMTGLGIDEQSALCVEPDGTARLYSNIGGYAWLMQNVAPTVLKPKTQLVASDIKITGIGTDSVLNLKSLLVEKPAFRQAYEIKNGELTKIMKWSLAIHGGAGVIERGDLTKEKEAAYRLGLNKALEAGQAVLEKGGSALDAVEASVRVMEDNPLFNAGKGAVFTAQGVNELDAAIMEGTTLKAGAVAGVTRSKNPISLARAVMEKSGRLMLARDGADRFSIENGLEQVDPSYFYTEERWQQLQAWRAKKFGAIDQTHRFGTVGAVALDADGHLAAATSTGGLTGKVFGRIGDTPIIGAGTFADDRYCAVSATGTGEYFIRESAGRQICDRVRWNNQSIHSAASDTLMAIGALGGDGGLIAMDKEGDVSFAINDLGMYRGWVASWRKPQTSIYPDDTLKAEGAEAKTSKEMH